MGGNRSGKSFMGIKEDCWVASGTHPFVRPPVPNRGRIGVTDFGVLEQVIWPKIEETLPKHSISRLQKGAKGLITGVHLTNGSFFDIMSYEQMPMKWESVDLDWVHFDEPPPLAIWRATIPRLIDRDGRAWFTLTPLEEPWLYEEIWEKCGIDSSFWGMMLDMRKNPYLSRVAVAAFEKMVAAEEYDSRVLGNFRHLVGKVFKNFTDDFPYVVPDDYITIDPRWPRLMICDPHEKTPWATQWYALNPEIETVYRIDEFRHDPADGIEAYGNRVRRIESMQNAEVPDHMRVIDTYARKPTYNKGGNSLIDEISNITGLTFRPADKSDSNNRIWDLVNRYKINPATNMPRLITLARCDVARKEIKSYVWDRHRTKAGQYSAEKQTPIKKNDHAISCDFYMSAEWPLTAPDVDPLHVFGSSSNLVAREEVIRQVVETEDPDQIIRRALRNQRLRRSLGVVS